MMTWVTIKGSKKESITGEFKVRIRWNDEVVEMSRV